MTIELTEQQQQALDSGHDVPPRVVDPRTNTTYFLLRAEEYESLRELVEDEREQQAVLAYSMKQAAAVARENPY
jgi:hypothetical protein